MKKALLGISIPVFNQPQLLKYCLQSLRQQTVRDFNVYIYDDASSVSYKEVIAGFPDLSIYYQKAEKNKGALNNFVYAYNETAKKHFFVLKLHEDDQLSPVFIETVLKAINTEIKPAILLSKFECFPEHFEGVYENGLEDVPVYNIDREELCYRYIKNEAISFGSAVYNTEDFSNMILDLQTYSEFADRPFILNHLKPGHNIKLIDAPLYYYRNHLNDIRWKGLQVKHVFNLLKLYRNIIKNTYYVVEFKKLSTSVILDSFKNLRLSGNAPWLPIYILMGYRQKLISTKYLLLRNSFINRNITSMKRLIK